MIRPLAVAVIFALVAVIFALVGCSDSGPKDTSKVWAIQYSVGMPEVAAPSGAGFRFDFPGPSGHVNYVVHEPLPLVGRFSMSGEVVTSPDAVFHHRDPDCASPANFRFYFQRRGDDLSGNGPMQFYRWWAWATSALPLAPGPFSMTQDLEPVNWSSVFGVRGDAAVAEFEAAKADANVVGITFGGCFAGHGVYVSPGSASFSVSRFVVE